MQKYFPITWAPGFILSLIISLLNYFFCAMYIIISELCELIIFFLMFSYRQNVPVEFLKSEMAFETEESVLEFLAPFALTFSDESRQQLDCKNSMANIGNI